MRYLWVCVMKMEIQFLHTKLIYWVISKDVYFQMNQVFFSLFLLSYFSNFNTHTHKHTRMEDGSGKKEEERGRKEGRERGRRRQPHCLVGRLHLPLVRSHSLLRPESHPVTWDLLLKPVMKTCLWLALC